jgi:hypothetical protein
LEANLAKQYRWSSALTLVSPIVTEMSRAYFCPLWEIRMYEDHVMKKMKPFREHIATSRLTVTTPLPVPVKSASEEKRWLTIHLYRLSLTALATATALL